MHEEPWVHVDEEEMLVTADCGCTYTRECEPGHGDCYAHVQCKMHAAAADMLAALKGIAGTKKCYNPECGCAEQVARRAYNKATS